MNQARRYSPVVLLFLLSVCFLSCKTSPVPIKYNEINTKSDSLELFTPVWEHFKTGIDYLEGTVASPAMEFWGLRVDLRNPAVHITVTPPGPRTGIVPSMKTTTFAKQFSTDAAINANPFNTSTAREGTPLTIVGITVSGGILVSKPAPEYAALVFYKDGTAGIVMQDTLGETDQIEYAAGGFYIILKDGLFIDEISDFRKMVRHPRSAAGLSEDGRYLYLLVIDGRRPSSGGATEGETAQILVKMGAFRGMIFDGGGSTSLALRYPDGKIRAVNTPIHNGIPGQERAVAVNLGISVYNGE